MKKRLLAMTLALLLCLGLVPAALAAEGLEPVRPDRCGGYTGNWASPVRSYLFAVKGGYLRVEGGETITVERYDKGFNLLTSRKLPAELPLWGGFFAGEEYCFAVFGQENPNEDDGVETMRVVKYDMELNRLGAAAYTANNTTVPFDAGSLRMAECGGMLYIRTCHEMYTSDDGLNHQANVTLAVRERDMVITDEFSDVMNIGYGYVSHSFNQFIAVSKDKTLVALDHGDAHPRSAVLVTYAPKAGEEKFLKETHIPQGGGYYSISMGVTSTDLLTFKGMVGANYTGATLGGLALTGTHALVAGASMDQSEAGEDTTKNIFLAAAPLADITRDNTLSYLTHYTKEDQTIVQNPYLAAGEEGAWVLWEEWAAGSTALFVQPLDERGNPVGERRSFEGQPLCCAPIYTEGKLVWFTAGEGGAPVFRTLDTGTMTLSSHAAATPALAYPATQTVELDGEAVTFACYALKDAKGNLTNYIKLRDLAMLLNGTAAQFEVGWENGNVTVTTGAAYTPNGSELSTPYSGNRVYENAANPTAVDGGPAALSAFVLHDDDGGGYTYYKLRDLGEALGFNVGWSQERGTVFLETDKPYDPNN